MENEKMTENISSKDSKKKNGKKKWIIIAVVIVLFVAIVGSSGDEDKPSVETSVDSSISTTQNSSDKESEKETKNDNTTVEETTIDATKGIKVGSTVKDDDVAILYKSCNDNFKKYSQYADVKSGYKIIQAVFDFENISETNQTLNGFTCYADGVKCEEFYMVDDYSSPILETISAGRKFLDATVYYEVPKDAEVIELEYEANYWSGDKYIFIIE